MIIEPKEEITLQDYDKLSKEDKQNYVPIYKTKKIRKRSECETCGHFLSYYKGDKNIGKPLSYRKKSMWEQINDLMVRDMLGRTLNVVPFQGEDMKFPIKFKK